MWVFLKTVYIRNEQNVTDLHRLFDRVSYLFECNANDTYLLRMTHVFRRLFLEKYSMIFEKFPKRTRLNARLLLQGERGSSASAGKAYISVTISRCRRRVVQNVLVDRVVSSSVVSSSVVSEKSILRRRRRRRRRRRQS
jgi:hypothetical protein